MRDVKTLWRDVSHIRELKFSRDEYHARLARCQELIRAQGLDALLCHTHANILYLTGLETACWWMWYLLIVPAEGDPVILGHEADIHNALLSSWLDVEQVFPYPFDGADVIQASRDLIVRRGLATKRLGIETTPTLSLGLGFDYRLYQGLRAALPEADLVDTELLVESLQAIKSPAEIECFRKAAHLSAISVQAVVDTARAGRTDNDLAAALYHAIYTAGSESMAYQPLLTVGRRSGIVHTRWRRTVLTPSDTVFIEVGGCYNGYSAPMMRTIVLQPGPDPAMREIIDACLEAVRITIAGMRPGASGRELATTATAVMDALPDDLVKGGTRGYSLEAGAMMWHAWPGSISTNPRLSETILQAGHVMHVSANVRKTGRFALTFSETVLVTESGAEVLTNHLPLDVFVR